MAETDSKFADDLENFTGQCLCGNVKFRSLNPPYNVGYCHCDMCQRSLGNLFGTWVILKTRDLEFTSGQPKWYESSDRVRRGFCGDCGSPICYDPNDKDYTAMWIGTLDNREAFKPRAHWHTKNKIPWVDIHSHLPVRS
ncbi:GFA family protein [Roseibium sp.]|uniref:GFA family protein n=1 Tax=Roseibium sp. TaxID=1936156 RepID=UPI003D11F540